jgi:signal transduction histidine kinase
VATDRTKLGLVVRNLVSNALKYTEEGSVDIRLFESEEELVVEVRDTGIGISPEHLPLVFDLFRQVDQGPTRRRGGVGLGLYLVEQFSQRLGGRVCVESEIGRGSVFRVTVPMRASQTVVRAA